MLEKEKDPIMGGEVPLLVAKRKQTLLTGRENVINKLNAMIKLCINLKIF